MTRRIRLTEDQRRAKKAAYQRAYWQRQRALNSPQWQKYLAARRAWKRAHYQPHPRAYTRMPEEERQRRRQAYNSPLARYHGRQVIAHCGCWHPITAIPWSCPDCQGVVLTPITT